LDRTYTDLAPEEINRTLWHLSYPSLLAQAVHNGFTVFEAGLVAHYGTAELAALSLGYPITMIITNLGFGLGIGANSLTARLVGQGRWEQARQAAFLALTVAVTAGLLLAAVGYPVTWWILRWLRTPEETLRATMAYLAPYLVGAAVYFLQAVGTGLLQGMGRMAQSARVVFATVAVNALLDPFLLYGVGFVPEMGLPGVSLGAVIARGASAALAYGCYLRASGLWPLSFGTGPGWTLAKDILWVAVPSALARSAQPLCMLFLNGLLLSLGAAAVAARGVGARIEMLAYLPALAFAPTVLALTGQNWGAGNAFMARQVPRYAARLIGAVMALIGLFVLVAPGAVWDPVAPDVALRGPGYSYMRIMGASYFLVGLDMIYSAALQGLGLGYPPMVITLVRVWGISLPVSYLLVRCFGMGPEGVWLSLALGNLWAGVAAPVWFWHAVSARRRAAAPVRRTR
jgi:putative MATE family efflux protein